jgi:hypothetical protein
MLLYAVHLVGLSTTLPHGAGQAERAEREVDAETALAVVATAIEAASRIIFIF